MTDETLVMLSPAQTTVFANRFPKAVREQLPNSSATAPVNLIQARLDAGMDTHLITLDTGPARFLEGEGLTVTVVPRRPRKVLRDGYDEERKRMVEVLKNLQPSLCHAHWTYEYASAALDYGRAPVVVSAHDHTRNILRWAGIRYLPLFLMTQKNLKRAQVVTAVSPYVQDYVKTRRTGPTFCVPNLLSAAIHEAPDTSPERRCPVISSVGGWGALKNPKALLKGYQVFRERNPNIGLQLFGAGFEHDGPASHWANRYGLTEGVDFYGPRPYGECVERIAGSMALIHPSWEEAFPMPIAEALSLGVPVVANRDCPASAWLLKEGHLGTLCGSAPKEVADGLDLALSSTAEKQAEGQRAVHALCNPSRVLELYEEAYQAAKKRYSGGS